MYERIESEICKLYLEKVVLGELEEIFVLFIVNLLGKDFWEGISDGDFRVIELWYVRVGRDLRNLNLIFYFMIKEVEV